MCVCFVGSLGVVFDNLQNFVRNTSKLCNSSPGPRSVPLGTKLSPFKSKDFSIVDSFMSEKSVIILGLHTVPVMYNCFYYINGIYLLHRLIISSLFFFLFFSLLGSLEICVTTHNFV